jgi:hypothetical protein
VSDQRPEGDASERPAPDIRIVSGDPDDVEMAALTAVLAGVLEELAALRQAQKDTGPTAWQRSQRTLRTPLHAGHGRWNGFGV